MTPPDWLGAAIAGVPLLAVSLAVRLDLGRRRARERARQRAKDRHPTGRHLSADDLKWLAVVEATGDLTETTEGQR